MSADNPTLIATPDAAFHLSVAELAVQLGYANVTEVGEVLLAIPSYVQSALPWTPRRIWVEAGPLDDTEWRALNQELQRRRSTPVSELDESRDETLDQTNAPGDSAFDDDTTESTLSRESEEPASQSQRYIIGSQLGKGGAGRVFRAYDRTLQRVVALKVPLTASNTFSAPNFDTEARTTGMLEHPNIIPVYDMGVLPSGEQFYAMKRITGRSLRDVLRDLKIGRHEAVRRWTETELLRIFVDVLRAVDFAHHRNTLHRDLKPENIMIGDFGEVYVMDWGLAVSGDATTPHADGETPTVGTPAYMSPEQASGVQVLDERTDIYSLGVILYEILTFTAPSKRETVFETLLAVASEAVLPPSKLSRKPLAYELDAIVMKALAKNPNDRYANIAEFRNDLSVYLTGRHPKHAERCYQEAKGILQEYDELSRELETQRKRISYLAARLPSDATIDERREYWSAIERANNMEREQNDRFEQFVRLQLAALTADPSFDRARDALASITFRMWNDADRQHDQRYLDYFAIITREFDVQRRYTPLLDSPTSMDLTIDAPGYQAFLQPVNTEDLQFELQPAIAIGEPPLYYPQLARGSWLLTLKKIGEPLIRVPIRSRAERPVHLYIHTEKSKNIPADFLFVHRGESMIGGDTRALDPLVSRIQEIPSFCASIFHISLIQYLEWIRDLDVTRPGSAEERLPVLRRGAPLIRRFENDTFHICSNALRQLNPTFQRIEEYPIVGIRAQDARAYAQWRSQRDGRRYRLPTELEFERIARGADGRFYPWGNVFDPALCANLKSHPAAPALQSLGAVPADVGPFGHRDLAGNVREFCERDDANGTVLRGGSWQSDQHACRASSRIVADAERRRDDVSFRLVCER